MAPASALHVYLVLVFLSALRGESRYLEVKSSPEEEDFLHISPDWKRELSEGHIYRRSLRCIDMLSLEGQFTFTAQQPALHCALFFIGDPEDLITIEYDFVNIDCRGGDFLKVFDGWILKGEKFPSSLDHPLSTPERYTDYCAHTDSHRIYRSSQNVAMIFFRVQEPGNGFTVTIRKMTNLFPCNVISQTPNGRFTMVIPHLHRNCSFSIIYPVVIKISDVALGHLSELQLKDSGGKSCSLLHLNHLNQNCSQATTLASTRNPPIGCNGVGDFVELLGGAGLDPSKMFPLADLCHSFHGPARMKIGCDNTVVRMVSSGKFVNRVTFEYNQLDRRNDLEESGQGNSVEEVCFPTD